MGVPEVAVGLHSSSGGAGGFPHGRTCMACCYSAALCTPQEHIPHQKVFLQSVEMMQITNVFQEYDDFTMEISNLSGVEFGQERIQQRS